MTARVTVTKRQWPPNNYTATPDLKCLQHPEARKLAREMLSAGWVGRKTSNNRIRLISPGEHRATATVPGNPKDCHSIPNCESIFTNWLKKRSKRQVDDFYPKRFPCRHHRQCKSSFASLVDLRNHEKECKRVPQLFSDLPTTEIPVQAAAQVAIQADVVAAPEKRAMTGGKFDCKEIGCHFSGKSNQALGVHKGRRHGLSLRCPHGCPHVICASEETLITHLEKFHGAEADAPAPKPSSGTPNSPALPVTTEAAVQGPAAVALQAQPVAHPVPVEDWLDLLPAMTPEEFTDVEQRVLTERGRRDVEALNSQAKFDELRAKVEGLEAANESLRGRLDRVIEAAK